MTTQGLLSGKTVWIVFAAYFLFLIAIARYTTWKEKRDAGKVDLQGGRFKWPVMVMTYIASCMSVWVFFAGPGAYYRYGLGYFFSEMCIYSMFPIICYFTMTKVWLVNQQKHFTTPAGFLLLPLQVQGADRYHRHGLHYLRRAVYLGGTGSRWTRG